MNLQEIIAEKEKEGRDNVFAALGSKYLLVESTDAGDSWDLSGQTQSISGEDRNFFMEVKSRDVKSTSYKTCFLEYKKFHYLKHVADSHNGDMFYACSYTDDLLYVFNLRKLNLTDIYISTIDAPKVSMTSQEDKTPKLMIELPFALGKKYKIK